ncbi:MAG: prepilin-type N-terminal cleavage/methylation domain-containing protein [Patescibacteria group bacterium]
MPKQKMTAGFTLIEILVVIAIMGALSSFLIINFRVNEDSRKFKNDSLLVMDGFKKAQTMALASQLVEGRAPVGYAVLLDDCSFGSCSYEIASYGGDKKDFSNQSDFKTIEKVNLSEEVELKAKNSRIIFFPPRAESVILVNGEITNYLPVELRHKKGKLLPICVTVSGMSGRIDSSPCSM